MLGQNYTIVINTLFSGIACNLSGVMVFGCFNCSLLILTIISIQRFFLITRPHNTFTTNKNICLVRLSTCWVRGKSLFPLTQQLSRGDFAHMDHLPKRNFSLGSPICDFQDCLALECDYMNRFSTISSSSKTPLDSQYNFFRRKKPNKKFRNFACLIPLIKVRVDRIRIGQVWCRW